MVICPFNLVQFIIIFFYLQEEPIQGFKVSNYLEFMEELEHSYRNIVLTDMKSIENPVE